MARHNGKSRHRGRSSSVRVGKIDPERERVYSAPPTGRESIYYDQQSEKTTSATDVISVDNIDALCGQLETIQIIQNAEPSYNEQFTSQALVHARRGPTRPSITVPSCSYSVNEANSNIMSRDQFAAHLEAYAATLSKESRTQRLRRVLKRRLRASSSKIAGLELRKHQDTEKAILGHDLWHQMRKTQIPADFGDDLDLLIREHLLAEHQEKLLLCRCPKVCTCRTPSTLTAWQVKLRDLYIERVFDFEQRQDMRRDHRSRQRGDIRFAHWGNVCKKYADIFARRRRS